MFRNLSRGFVVDYAGVRARIEAGDIGGAAVDVFPVEPGGRGDESQVFTPVPSATLRTAQSK